MRLTAPNKSTNLSLKANWSRCPPKIPSCNVQHLRIHSDVCKDQPSAAGNGEDGHQHQYNHNRSQQYKVYLEVLSRGLVGAERPATPMYASRDEFVTLLGWVVMRWPCALNPSAAVTKVCPSDHLHLAHSIRAPHQAIVTVADAVVGNNEFSTAS